MVKKIILAILVLLIGFYGFGLTRTHNIETEIEIAAPPEAVWAVLTDFAAYGEWNPFILSVEGEARQGATLDAVIHAVGGAGMDKPQAFKPLVLEARANQELRWRGRLLVPGLFDGEHYFAMVPSNGGTRFIHGEHFRGLLLLAFDMDEFQPSYVALNEAIKARVEAMEAEVMD